MSQSQCGWPSSQTSYRSSPWWAVTLTIKLIERGPIPRQQAFPPHRAYPVLAPVSRRCSEPQGMFPRVTHPSATDTEMPVRLACVKPAASVRSEPGSNSQVVSSRPDARPVTLLGQTSGSIPKPSRIDVFQNTSAPHPAEAGPGRDDSRNVTVGEFSRRASLRSARHKAKPQGPRRPRFPFSRCDCQTAQGSTKPTPKTSSPAQSEHQRRRRHTRHTLPGHDQPNRNPEASKPAARSQATPPVDDPYLRPQTKTVNTRFAKTSKRHRRVETATTVQNRGRAGRPVAATSATRQNSGAGEGWHAGTDASAPGQGRVDGRFEPPAPRPERLRAPP